MLLTMLKITSGYHADSFIHFVSFQQHIAKTKKISIGQTVIFQYNPLFFLLKKPANGTGNRHFTTYILFPKKGLHLAWPINFLNNGSGGYTLLPITFLMLVSPISRYIQFCWPNCTNDLKYLPGKVRSVVQDE